MKKFRLAKYDLSHSVEDIEKIINEHYEHEVWEAVSVSADRTGIFVFYRRYRG